MKLLYPTSHHPLSHYPKTNDASQKNLCQNHGLYAPLWSLHSLWVIDFLLQLQPKKRFIAQHPLHKQGLPDPLLLEPDMEVIRTLDVFLQVVDELEPWPPRGVQRCPFQLEIFHNSMLISMLGHDTPYLPQEKRK